MSLPFTAFRLLLSSKANQQYKGEIVQSVRDLLTRRINFVSQELGGREVTGGVLMTDEHPSKSDPEPHYTVDLYGVNEDAIDEPIGTAHVYPGPKDRLLVFTEPREKAEQAFKERVAKYQAAVKSGSTVVYLPGCM